MSTSTSTQTPIAPFKESIPYPKEQIIHSFSKFVNAGYGIKAYNSESALQAYVAKIVGLCMNDTTITNCVGSDWTLAWGPIVFSNTPDANSVVVDNAMMMVYSPLNNLIIVAIAGTNIDSSYGWLTEDFNGATTVSWQSVVGNNVSVPSGASISAGTNDGLEKLLSMQDSNGYTLITALSNLLAESGTGTGLELAVCGHSLGGALSPAMALYLSNIQSDSSLNWNTSKKVTTISAWPTAGPTPGNADFATYLPTIVSYTSRYNTLDVVPQGWMQTSLSTVPTLYDSYITPVKGGTPQDVTLGILATGAILRSYNVTMGSVLPVVTNNDYQQAQPWTPITGSFDFTTDFKYSIGVQYILGQLNLSTGMAQYENYFTNVARFIVQMGYQHTIAYDSMLGIPTVAGEYTSILNNNNPDGQTLDEMHHEAAVKAIGLGPQMKNLDFGKIAQAVRENAATHTEAVTV
ncbi:lipase family protein [Taibaiella soli]|uniref:Fungal lipase-type domain-containing protein n=1 Tax=Taibaiella soli TaxID=1649169 RepID=A0A2W2B3H2_9BACT|nr:hypothetical protein [Taibaiella soli]PZF74558.1 hypothetical protein DN068_02995 [Taibaiella soli]